MHQKSNLHIILSSILSDFPTDSNKVPNMRRMAQMMSHALRFLVLFLKFKLPQVNRKQTDFNRGNHEMIPVIIAEFKIT